MSKYTPTVQNALELHQKGDYGNAKLLYVKALEENPYDAQALQLLGVILYAEEEYESAAQLIKNAIKIDPTMYEARNNLGLIYQKSNAYDLAVECYQHAIKLQPKKALAYNNIAILYKEKKDFALALSHYQSAIECEPEYTDAYKNLANLYYEMNDFSNIEKIYKKVLQLKSFDPDIYLNLAKTLQVLDRTEEACHFMSEYLRYGQTDFQVQTSLAIYSWIEGNTDDCKKYLNDIKKTQFDTTKPQDRFVIAYKTFLQALMDYKKKEPSSYTLDTSLPVLYVVGDSHSLSYSNLKISYKGEIHRVVTKIIIGCKAWHLSSGENNRYKEQFKNIIGSFDDRSNVLILLGEIDCRLDEGILKHNKKYPSDLDVTIPTFVKNYVDYCTHVCQHKKITPLYSLVPAPMFDNTVASKEKDRLKHVIKTFNSSLKEILLMENIYDTYTLTAGQNGESNLHYHIDRWHLLPQAIKIL